MNSFSIQAYSIEDMIAQLATVPFKPTLGIAFASVSLDISRMTEVMSHLDFPVIGASSCGEFVHDQRLSDVLSYHEVISSESVVMLLLDLPSDRFQTYHATRADVASDLALGETIGQWAVQRFTQPQLIVLASGLSLNGDELVRGMMHHKRDMTIFGGLAGDDSRFQQTWVFANGQAIDHGAVALALDADYVEMVGSSVSGWQGIGSLKTVTSSEGNHVYTIDRQPALDTYMHYLNITEDELPQVGVDYPMLLKQGKESILRAVVMVDKQARALVFAGNVPQGSQVQFASCPGSEVLQSSKLALDELHLKHQQADVVIAFSCMARHLALGPDIQEEINHAVDLWHAPVIGFFTYGEIGPNAANVTCLHNETLSLLLLKQK